jgi:hypothetical protein
MAGTSPAMTKHARNRFQARANFLNPINLIWVVHPRVEKYSAFQSAQIISVSLVPPHRGAARDRHGRGAGRGGRGWLAGRAVPTRTAKSYGPDASTPASSQRSDPLATVTRKSDHRGEYEGNRKTIARGVPGETGVTVVTNARAFYLPRAAADAPAVRHSPRPLIFWAKGSCTTRAKRAARSRGRVCNRPLTRHRPA